MTGTPPAPPWRWRDVMQAPHRLGFLLAMVVLAASAAWWAMVQLDRAGLAMALPYAVSPSLAHAAVMVFGFLPLFFAGFLFTAGPRWLAVTGPSAPALALPLFAEAAGWLLWLAGAHSARWVALAGVALATAGLAAVTLRFWLLLAASRVADRLHPTLVGVAHLVGTACLAGFGVALALDAQEAARGLALTGLWGFVVVVFVTVAHRMIPFFSAPGDVEVSAWRPEWMLVIMVAAATLEAAAVWVEIAVGAPPVWLALRGLLEFAAGATLLRVALAWGFLKSLRIRLLAMMHVGLVWLGVGFTLAGAANLLAAVADVPLWPLGALHALSMGCLGSLLLAMVTRVTCGRGGRAEVTDDPVWTLFVLLQLAALVRLAATVAGAGSQALLTLAAVLWAGIMCTWGWRYGNWYGRPRPDGRPG